MWVASYNILVQDTHDISLLVLKPYSWNTWIRLNQIQACPKWHILSVVAKHKYKSHKRDQDPILFTHKLDHILYIDIYDLLSFAYMIEF